MSDEKVRYGIIREQGEYMEPAYLNDDENAVIIASSYNNSKDKDIEDE